MTQRIFAVDFSGAANWQGVSVSYEHSDRRSGALSLSADLLAQLFGTRQQLAALCKGSRHGRFSRLSRGICGTSRRLANRSTQLIIAIVALGHAVFRFNQSRACPSLRDRRLFG